MRSNDNRSWELEGREEAEGKSSNFIFKADGSKEATSMLKEQEIKVTSTQNGCHDDTGKTWR